MVLIHKRIMQPHAFPLPIHSAVQAIGFILYGLTTLRSATTKMWVVNPEVGNGRDLG